ncbi:hypothetical protein T03_13738 [Trichinella britovi]|uniref:Uncharacterized protein n=1 Tax=Trichinella britovi TaxID=45882 RepID=A0A0V1D373_TRIBR|nr:hypothetical protein T03_13738 [Trichinella britovi]
MNEIAAFFGNYPLLNMWCFHKDSFQCKSKSKKTRKLWPQALPSGYAQGQIKICICLQAIPQAIYSTIFDLRGFLCKFLIASGPRRRLRLCPRANKNLHMPSGYPPGNL